MAESRQADMRASWLALLLMVVAAGVAPRAQLLFRPPQAAVDPPRPVRISVIVTDRQGRPVSGLTARDFELRDDDLVQKIDSVEARTPQPRRLALLLDEFHVADANASRVRDAVGQFVDRHLRSDDLVVVLKPLDSLPAIRLTNDRDQIRAAIASFEGRAGNYEPRSALEEQTVGRSPALAQTARAQIVLSALRALSARLGAPGGRAAIVMVSEGFLPEPRAIPARALPDLGIVERFANRYDVAIHAIDPGQLAAPAADGPETTLQRLAAQTGGTFVSGNLPEALDRIGRELDSGYVLTYQPAHGEDGKFHPVAVRVLRRDANVRVRAGYVSRPSEEMRQAMRAALTPPPEEMRLLRRSPLIDVWSGITRAGDSRGRVVVTWEPTRLTAPGSKSIASRVTLKATTKEGGLLFDGSLDPVRGPRETAGLADRAEFDAPAGRVQLDMIVLGERGEKLDEDTRDLEVPALKGPTMVLLPPVVLATRSAKEFHEVSADEDAVPTPSREFRRTDRLLIRVPAYEPGGQAARVTVRLLNRVGQQVQQLDAVGGAAATGVTQFDLPLAPLAPGEYYLQLTASGSAGTSEQRVSFRITG
jgi:VWFA-related protein